MSSNPYYIRKPRSIPALHLSNIQIHFIAHIPQAIDQRFELGQGLAAVIPTSFARERGDRCDAALQLLKRMVGRMDQYRLPARHLRQTDLLTLPWITPLLQPVPAFRNAAQARNIVDIRQLDRMADVLALKGDGAICSLCSVRTSEQQGVLSGHIS